MELYHFKIGVSEVNSPNLGFRCQFGCMQIECLLFPVQWIVDLSDELKNAIIWNLTNLSTDFYTFILIMTAKYVVCVCVHACVCICFYFIQSGSYYNSSNIHLKKQEFDFCDWCYVVYIRLKFMRLGFASKLSLMLYPRHEIPYSRAASYAVET